MMKPLSVAACLFRFWRLGLVDLGARPIAGHELACLIDPFVAGNAPFRLERRLDRLDLLRRQRRDLGKARIAKLAERLPDLGADARDQRQIVGRALIGSPRRLRCSSGFGGNGGGFGGNGSGALLRFAPVGEDLGDPHLHEILPMAVLAPEMLAPLLLEDDELGAARQRRHLARDGGAGNQRRAERDAALARNHQNFAELDLIAGIGRKPLDLDDIFGGDAILLAARPYDSIHGFSPILTRRRRHAEARTWGEAILLRRALGSDIWRDQAKPCRRGGALL